MSLDQSLVTAMENEARWMINSGLSSQTSIPNFTDYLSFDGLNAVEPESANVIH